MSEEDPFAPSAGLPSISFATKDQYGNLGSKPVGTRIGGRVLKAPSTVQSRDFDKGTPEFWPDGNEKKSVVVDIDVDGTEMSLWVKKPSQLFKEFGEAIARAGGVPVGPGATIFVTLAGFAAPEAGKAPAKIYRVEYTPANSFATDAYSSNGNGAAVAGPPSTPEGYTLDSLLAAGWTATQIATSYPQLIPPTPVTAPPPPPAPAAAPPPPPAPPAAPAPPAPPAVTQSERDAKIAAMSSADRALLGL